MKNIKYNDGQVVRMGDSVEVHRVLRKNVKGTVVAVYDPTKPSPPRGNNDYGVSIKLEDGTVLWGVPNEKTKLLSREAN